MITNYNNVPTVAFTGAAGDIYRLSREMGGDPVKAVQAYRGYRREIVDGLQGALGFERLRDFRLNDGRLKTTAEGSFKRVRARAKRKLLENGKTVTMHGHPIRTPFSMNDLNRLALDENRASIVFFPDGTYTSLFKTPKFNVDLYDQMLRSNRKKSHFWDYKDMDIFIKKLAKKSGLEYSGFPKPRKGKLLDNIRRFVLSLSE